MSRMYAVIYKCSLCDRLVSTNKGFEASEDQLPEYLGKVVRNQKFLGNLFLYSVPMQIPHKCEDGSAGLAVFAGFKRI